MTPELECNLKYRVQFADGQFKFIDQNSVTIKKWRDTTIVDSAPVQLPHTEIPPSVVRLLTEIVHQPSYVLSCDFMSAYVSLTRESTVAARKKTTRRRRLGHEHVAYDRINSAGKPIIPALFRDDTTHANELDAIAIEYNKQLKSAEEIHLPPWAKTAAFVKHKISLTYNNLENGSLTIGVTDELKVYRFLLGEFCGALPLPGSFDESLEGKRAILVSRLGIDGDREQSKKVWKALQSLNVIVRNDKKQIVLLDGTPGSGKEIFGQAIHCGSLRAKDTKLKQLSVAGISRLALQQTLFGIMTPKGGLVDGLIAESEGATLFLDEFDKASIDTERLNFASALLRVLESDDYYPVDSREPRRVQDVNWILAGAFPFLGKTDEKSREARDRFPTDLWSRFTDRLQLENPVETRGYPKSMFIYWHFLETTRWMDRERTVLADLSKVNTVIGAVGRMLLWGEPRVPVGFQPDEPIKPGEIILEVAAKFEAELEKEPKKKKPKTKTRKRRLGKYGARTVRQASIVASRELRARVIEKLSKTEKLQGITATDIKIVMKRVAAVLEMTKMSE